MLFPEVTADVFLFCAWHHRGSFVLQVKNRCGSVSGCGSPRVPPLSPLAGRWEPPPCMWVNLQGLGASGAVAVLGPHRRPVISRQNHAFPSGYTTARVPNAVNPVVPGEPLCCNLLSPTSPWHPGGFARSLTQRRLPAPHGSLPSLGSGVSLLPLLWYKLQVPTAPKQLRCSRATPSQPLLAKRSQSSLRELPDLPRRQPLGDSTLQNEDFPDRWPLAVKR